MPAGLDARVDAVRRLRFAGRRARLGLWSAALCASALWACSSRVPLAPWPGPAPVASASAKATVSPSAAAAMPSSATVPTTALTSATSAPSLTRQTESLGVAMRFPEPAVAYRTPAFEPGHAGFTSNAELRTLMHGLAREGDGGAGSTLVQLVEVGSSQTGVPLEALHFSRANGARPPSTSGNGARPALRPTVLLVGQQHGDEPAGSEALLVIAQELAGGGSLTALLDRIDVVVMPRANPDGAATEQRTTASGIDVNRDHLLLRTPEAQAQARLVREFNPLVVVDSHEFAAIGRYLEKFGAVERQDALIQYAMTANLPAFVTKASEEWFRKPMLQALRTQGLSNDWYHTTSADMADKKVSMGGVQPDTGRNVNGLRNTISFLVETRGGGLGRAHLARRVQAQVTAVASVLQSAAGRADDLMKLRRFVDAELIAKACQGEMVVEAAATPSEYSLQMLDPQTGADKTVTVAWDSALELAVVKRRARPCGYWLGADQVDAVLHLRTLGVQVQRLDEPGALPGEAYAETARELAARSDVRSSIGEGGGVLLVKVDLVPALIDAPAGSYYVGLDQPLANLVVAAMEPDTQNGFVAHRIVTALKSQARVLARPDMRTTPMP